jgi:hypothetical protein
MNSTFACPLSVGQRVRHIDYMGQRVTGVIHGLSVCPERGLMVDCRLDDPIVIPADEHSAEIKIWSQHAQAHEFTPFDERDEQIEQLREAVAAYQRFMHAAPHLMEAVKSARACIAQDRQALADTHMNPATNAVDDEGQAGLDEYDAVLRQIDAAVALATGSAA